MFACCSKYSTAFSVTRVSRVLLIVFVISLPIISGLISWMAYRGDIVTITRSPLTPYTTMVTTSSDNLPVEGWWLHDATSCGTVVIVPGWGQGRSSQLETAEALARQGYGVVVYDPRGGTGHSSYGTREQFDVTAIIAWLTERGIPESSIVLMGHSMGGVAAQLVAAEHQNLAGLILESSLYNIQDVKVQVAREYRFVFPTVYAAAASLYDRLVWKIPSTNLAAARRAITQPVLILHTSDDPKARLSTMQRAQDQLQNSTSVVLPGDHRQLLDDDAAIIRSQTEIISFLPTVLTCE